MLTVVVQVVTAVLLASAGLLKLRNPAALRSAAVDLGMPSRVTTSGQHRVHFGTEQLVGPHGHPQMIMVRWPDHPTVISPRRYADTANVIMRLFATAHIELARISARRL